MGTAQIALSVKRLFTRPLTEDPTAERPVRTAPGARFVKALNTIGSGMMADLDFGNEPARLFRCDGDGARARPRHRVPTPDPPHALTTDSHATVMRCSCSGNTSRAISFSVMRGWRSPIDADAQRTPLRRSSPQALPVASREVHSGRGRRARHESWQRLVERPARFISPLRKGDTCSPWPHRASAKGRASRSDPCAPAARAPRPLLRTAS